MQSPTHWCLKEHPAHIKIQSSARLSLLTFTCSVVCLLPQVHSNKLENAVLVAPVFHPLWCLEAQRKGMVINMEAILQVENLTKHYPGFLLDHVSFAVPAGTIMGLVGENGAGKSTTIHAILDLIKKDDGAVTFWGRDLSASKQMKEDIGIVFDDVNFYDTLTPAQVGKICSAAYQQWDDRLYQDFLNRFGLPTKKEIKTFSKGMKTKLCIAVALSHKPKPLILDEATSGIDPVIYLYQRDPVQYDDRHNLYF